MQAESTGNDSRAAAVDVDEEVDAEPKMADSSAAVVMGLSQQQEQVTLVYSEASALVGRRQLVAVAAERVIEGLLRQQCLMMRSWALAYLLLVDCSSSFDCWECLSLVD